MKYVLDDATITGRKIIASVHLWILCSHFVSVVVDTYLPMHYHVALRFNIHLSVRLTRRKRCYLFE